MSCLLNKSQIDRNRLFESMRHRKVRCKNGFQIFPWLITHCEWTEGNLLNSFLPAVFRSQVFSFFERAHHSMWLRLGSLGYTEAPQSTLKRYTCRMCTLSSWIPQERSAGVMGNRCGCFSPLSLICFTHSAVRLLWCLGRAHSQLYALTHPLPPKWEIINTHQSDTGKCWLLVHKKCGHRVYHS